ncbi:MAG TPA: ASCH domain-containing protein [Thermoanaerobaculia bacterium]
MERCWSKIAHKSERPGIGRLTWRGNSRLRRDGGAVLIVLPFALSIKQPHAEAIIDNIKTIENRSWHPPARIVGKRIWVHASKRVAPDTWMYRDYMRYFAGECGTRHCTEQGYHGDCPEPRPRPDIARGAIIGSVKVTGSYITTFEGSVPPDGPAFEKYWRNLTHHDGNEGPICWTLEAPRRCEPVYLNGKLNIWPVPPAVLKRLP